MTVGLLHPDEVTRLIHDRVESHNWWLIVSSGHTDLPELIENRYYSGKRSHDFEIVISARPWLVLVFARKRSMSAEQLADCMVELSGNQEGLLEALHERDIIFPAGSEGDGIAAMHAFSDLATKAGID